MVELIYGKNGSGKSYYLNEKWKENKEGSLFIKSSDFITSGDNSISLSKDNFESFLKLKKELEEVILEETDFTRTSMKKFFEVCGIKDLTIESISKFEFNYNSLEPDISLDNISFIINHKIKDISLAKSLNSDKVSFEYAKVFALFEKMQTKKTFQLLKSEEIISLNGGVISRYREEANGGDYGEVFSGMSETQLLKLEYRHFEDLVFNINKEGYESLKENSKNALNYFLKSNNNNVLKRMKSVALLILKESKYLTGLLNRTDVFSIICNQEISEIKYVSNSNKVIFKFEAAYLLSMGENSILNLWYLIEKNNSKRIILDDPYDFLDFNNQIILNNYISSSLIEAKNNIEEVIISSHSITPIKKLETELKDAEGIFPKFTTLTKNRTGAKNIKKNGSPMTMNVADYLIEKDGSKKSKLTKCLDENKLLVYITFLAMSRFYGKVGDLFSSKKTVFSSTLSQELWNKFTNEIIHYNENFDNKYFKNMFPNFMKFNQKEKFNTNIEFCNFMIKKIQEADKKYIKTGAKYAYGVAPIHMLDFWSSIITRSKIERDMILKGFEIKDIKSGAITNIKTKNQFIEASNIIHELDYSK